MVAAETTTTIRAAVATRRHRGGRDREPVLDRALAPDLTRRAPIRPDLALELDRDLDLALVTTDAELQRRVRR